MALLWSLIFDLSVLAQYPAIPLDIDSQRVMLRTTENDTARCLLHISLCVDLRYSDPEEALDHGYKAIEACRAVRIPRLHSVALTNTGVCLKNAGKYAEGLDLFQQAYHLQDSLGLKDKVLGTLRSMGSLHYMQGKYDRALETAQLARKVLDTLDLPEHRAGVDNSFGDAYRGLGILDSSIHYYTEGMKEAEANGLALEYGVAVNGLGLTYFDRKDYRNSALYYERSLELARQLGRPDAEAASLLNAGSAYGMLGGHAKGVDYLTRALKMGEEQKDLYLQYECLKSLAELDGRVGAHKSGFEHLQRMHFVADSIKAIENRKLTAEFEVRFDTERKEKEIEVLGLEKHVQAEALDKERLRRNVLIGGLLAVLVFAVVVFLQRNRIRKEKQRSEELLLNILPEETAEELKAKGSAEAKLFDEVTVLFTDFKDFTQVAETMTPQALVAEIHHCFKAFDTIMEKNGIEKIKTIGDAYMAAGGLPVANRTNARDVVQAGLEVQAFIRDYRMQRQAEGRPGFDIRIGIHTGPVVAGIVGIKKFAYDIWGDTVNTASRMESSGEPGKVNISGTTYELVKDAFRCTHRGKIQAKHKGEIDMYFVEGVV
ncbi:MAG TPA: adenylate/guanylate cyclase domain-containing protein [Flavobacteriales bacterium]|nr:adenylate/guanylate cyclase domain-containing protein [Flavobacteriales bacterium]